ncbi:hypothetical protein FRC03_008316 [Tulasnella sp. 419]|nr:hypothetical protein FRC02_004729 [Tulasnella sp. 418]KAG8959194.1 hypothetical protein FRC03_008316 [Tulasnella sp. 419]
MAKTRLNAVAFISSNNHPILVRTFTGLQDDLKYHYVAHTSLDVIEERVAATTKLGECFLGHLFSMEDLAVYGWISPTKLKIVIALALTDAVYRDQDIVTIFKALHVAYHQSLSNPFLRLLVSPDSVDDPAALLSASGGGKSRWKGLAERVDAIGKAVNSPSD